MDYKAQKIERTKRGSSQIGNRDGEPGESEGRTRKHHHFHRPAFSFSYAIEAGGIYNFSCERLKKCGPTSITLVHNISMPSYPRRYQYHVKKRGGLKTIISYIYRKTIIIKGLRTWVPYSFSDTQNYLEHVLILLPYQINKIKNVI